MHELLLAYDDMTYFSQQSTKRFAVRLDLLADLIDLFMRDIIVYRCVRHLTYLSNQ